MQDAQGLLDQKDVDEQVKKEERQSRGLGGRAHRGPRCCSICGKPGHNVRTCQKAKEISNVSNFKVSIVDN